MEIKKHKIGVIEVGIFSSSLMVLGLILWFFTLTFFGSNGNSEAKLLVAVGPSAGQVVSPKFLEKPIPLPSSGEELSLPSDVAAQTQPEELPVSKEPTVAPPSVPAPKTVAEMELQPPQPEPPRPKIEPIEPQPKETPPTAQLEPAATAEPTLKSKPASEPESVSSQPQATETEVSPPTSMPSVPLAATKNESVEVIEFQPLSGRDPTLSSGEVLVMERRRKEAKAQASKAQEKFVLRQKAADPFESLKNKIVVQGVLHTEKGIVAIVNDQIVSKGAEVMGAKILQILGNRVVFKYQNKIFEKNVKQ